MVFPKFADGKLQGKYKNYIFQSLLTFVCMSFVLLLYKLLGGIIVASIGASSFILFVTPHTNGSRAKNIVGGYICGAVSGMVFGLLHNYISGFSFFGAHYALIFICAASSAVTTFLMISTKLVHPPAAALALGLSADPNCIMTAMAAVGGVTILCAARRLLGNYLKDLI
jgi:CBS-domain-containing membrane protein